MQKFPLDPHRDPHGEMSGWKQWSKQAATSSFLDKKPPKSLVPQGLEGSTAVGKDEVGSSNLPSSSKKHRKLRLSVLFRCKNAENGASKNVGQAPTHTVTHTRKCADRLKEYRRGGFAPSPIFLIFFFCSHHLCHEISHRLCGLVLLLPCCVCVGSQGESRIIVTQHTTDGFHIHAVL